MKTYSYGLVLGIALSIIIIISNVIFPDNSPDSSPGMLFVALLIGGFIVLSSYHAGKKYKNPNIVLKVGILTSLIGFLIPMMTFFIVDNMFLDIVSRQADKIVNFQGGHYPSMREMINQGLLRGVLFGTPASIVFGFACGFIGGIIYRKKIAIMVTLLIGGVVIAIIGISQVLYLKKAHSTFENYYAFRGCMQLLKKTQEYGTCKLSSGQIIKIVKSQGKWYLDGDLPCGFLCF